MSNSRLDPDAPGLYASAAPEDNINDATRVPMRYDDSSHELLVRKDSLMDMITKTQLQQKAMIEALQLPKTELTVFDGNPLHYRTFIKTFEDVVHNNTVDDTARLARLMQYCNDKVKKVLQCCSILPANEGYTKARQIMKERFGNNAAIAEAWIAKVIERPAMKNNDRKALQEFS